MSEETIRKLNELGLHGMTQKLRELSASPQYSQYSHDDLLAVLVDHEFDRRKNNKIKRLLHDAKIKLPMACVEEINYSAGRNLRKEEFKDLMSCSFIEHKQNILISGATGVGKTYIACALAHLACRNGFSTCYYRVARLLEYLKTERALGNYLKAVEKLGRIKLLVMDDLGPDILAKEDRNTFFEIIDERHLVAPTIIASQLPLNQWHDLFDDAATADAICDRVFQNSHKIQLKGDSMRKK